MFKVFSLLAQRLRSRCSLISASWIRRLRIPLGCLVGLFPLVGIAETKKIPASTYYSKIVEITTHVRSDADLSDVRDFISKVPTDVVSGNDLRDRVSNLTQYIFGTLNIVPDRSYSSRGRHDNILPDTVLKNRRGHCLGITILYLLAAERTKIDAYLVRTPDHVFPRLCDGKTCLNVETLKKGAILEDSYYVKNSLIPEQALKNGLYLSSLSNPRELAASIYLGLGYANASRNPKIAETYYRRSAENSKQFAEPYSNLAAIYAGRGDIHKALRLLEKAIGINPSHYASLLNIAVIYHNQKKFSKAQEFYDQAIRSNPLSVPAYRRRAALFELKKKKKLAVLDLDRILAIQPKYCDVLEDRIRLAGARDSTRVENQTKLKRLRESGVCLTAAI